jgi:hypothetical protein
MDMDDSSFLKGSFVNGTSNNQKDKNDSSQNENNNISEEQLKRIGELERLVET